MCGIVGIVGTSQVAPRILNGLRRLEYRGYDSAGIATISNGNIETRRAKGKLSELSDVMDAQPLQGNLGIGHTRWATHGPATTQNAHPHRTDHVAVVHNGIIENYRELKQDLEAQGAVFSSETDSEIIAHLITQQFLETDCIEQAAQRTFSKLTGTYAVAVIFSAVPDKILVARSGSPLAIGLGDGENYLGSDSFALAPLTNRIIYLDDGDVGILSRDKVEIFNAAGEEVEHNIQIIDASQAMVDKGNYRHFMAKEIMEQPDVLSRTFGQYIDPNSQRVSLPETDMDFSKVSRVMLVACGTAYFAALVGRNWVERYAKIPCSIDIASEFRYRDLPLASDTLMVFVSQSGETADTLAAMRYCLKLGLRTVGVVNVPESSLAREVDLVLPTYAGPEIGVASTKAFTAQLGTLAAFAIQLGRDNGAVLEQEEAKLVDALLATPRQANAVLECEDEIIKIAAQIMTATSALFMGRGHVYPLALEGALKLKEISYIHAEGFAAGELKHGSIALIDEAMPIVTIAPEGELFDKTISNMQEVLARKGSVILFSSEKGIKQAGEACMACIQMPELDPFTAPILYALPLQLLAYHTACLKGTDVDQPRNLAKSVTVE
jgi:glucosamine--fructose-6-phosphate aminotransferase (isomerizing)